MTTVTNAISTTGTTGVLSGGAAAPASQGPSIGDRFLTLLRRHSTRAQFIVVTHQKRTMEAADSLYGVSMGSDGISKVISRRLPREAAA